MHVLLDENVPVSVATTLEHHGHEVTSVRDIVPAGSPDPLVATVSEAIDAVLISFDGDFQKIAPRIPQGMRRRFRKLSRGWLRCSEPQAAHRVEGAIALIESEFKLARNRSDKRMMIWLSDSYIRTER